MQTGIESQCLSASFSSTGGTISHDRFLNLLCGIINKRTSLRVKLPKGVFDIAIAVHGVFE